MKKDTVLTDITDTGAIMDIMVTTDIMAERNIAGEKSEISPTFNESDIFYFSGPEKQDLRKAKAINADKASVSFEKGAALMLQGERETFGE